MGFFEKTFGFAESNYRSTQKALLDAATFSFAPPTPTRGYWQEHCSFQLANDKAISAGTFSMPSVEQLRSRVQAQVTQFLEHQDQTGPKRQTKLYPSTITVRNMVGEARSLHSEPFHGILGKSPSADFPPDHHYIYQAASQFNLLEFPSPSVTPEAGIEGYIYDGTQGPACAIACAGGTAYRNYLVPMMMQGDGSIKQRGQTKDCQLNGLQLVQNYLKTCTTLQKVPWTVRNGYIEGNKRDMIALNTLLESDTQLHDALVSKLQIGIQEDVRVTDCPLDTSDNFQVTQTYNSAISIGYSRLSYYIWEPMAKIVLQATYEGTLLLAISKAMELATQDKTVTVLLTKVGGGVFRNDDSWICEAIAKAIHEVEQLVTMPCGIGLDIRIVHFGGIQEEYEILQRG